MSDFPTALAARVREAGSADEPLPDIFYGVSPDLIQRALDHDSWAVRRADWGIYA